MTDSPAPQSPAAPAGPSQALPTGPAGTGLRVLSISASPSAVSSTHALLTHVDRRLVGAGHRVTTLQLRDLPAQALVHADTADPAIAAALTAVAEADALVVATPVYQGSYSGLLKIFLDLVPQRGLRGKAVLPLATGGSPAHVLAVDYALRPLLSGLGAAHVGQGWFVPSAHVRSFPDGGLLLDPESAGPVARVTDDFLAHLAGRPATGDPAPATTRGRVDARAGAPDLQVLRVTADDPRARPLLADLAVEYGTRYGGSSAETELTEVPIIDFLAPHGTFLLLQEDGEVVAGGALRRHDPRTAEVKRVWTSGRHRRRGLAVRVMAELEVAAAELGYHRIHLTTGPRQPEARALYLATGYTPRFDVHADPESIGPLAFGKELVPGVGLPEWRQQSWAELRAARRRRDEPEREPVGAAS